MGRPARLAHAPCRIGAGVSRSLPVDVVEGGRAAAGPGPAPPAGASLDPAGRWTVALSPFARRAGRTTLGGRGPDDVRVGPILIKISQ